MTMQYPKVVGEMLMIGLVIVLIGVFAAALGNFLPTTRDPSVTILMTNDTHNITLYGIKAGTG